MKNLVLLVISIFISLSGEAQQLLNQSLSLQYNDVYIGRNVNVTFRQAFEKKAAVYAGVKFHLNQFTQMDSQMHIFMKRFYAEEKIQHFGIRAGIEKTFELKTANSEIYAFYDFQYTRAILRSNLYNPVALDSLGNVLFEDYLLKFGPVNAFENNLGIGGRFKLKDRLFFNAFMGGGIAFFTHEIMDNKHNTGIVGPKKDYEFCRMYGIGLDYRLK